MSLNWLLIWTVAISCGMTLINLLRFRISSLVRLLPTLFTIGVLLFAYSKDQDSAGFYAGGVWFVLILLPGIAVQLSNSCLSSRRFYAASLFSWIAFLLHPFSGMREQTRLVRALWLLSRQRDQEALDLLEAISRRNNSVGKSAFVISTRLQGRWDRFLRLIQTSKSPQGLLADPLLANIYLQALGETGQTELLIESFRRGLNKKKRGNSALMLNISRMKLAAFCGRIDVVAHLVDGPLGHFDADTKRFWLATAMQASGRLEDGNQSFQKLQSSKDRQIAIASQRRLAHPVRVLHHPPAGSSSIMSEIESDLDHETRFALISSPASSAHFATWGLVATLVGFFVYEMISGGVGQAVMQSTTLTMVEKASLLLQNTSSEENLIQIGALVLPTELEPNLTRRIFFSAFLHFGLLHLLMNVVGLVILGQRVEDAWGPIWMAIAYLLCAVLSIFLLTVIPLGATAENPYVLVGASGGVMGLLGCLLGYLAWGQVQKRNQLVAGEFRLLLFIVAFQMVFDQMTPNVSSECHLMGLLIGITCGLVAGLVKNGWPLRKKIPQPTLLRDSALKLD
ncbi:rhomboid family intramembrane serine protease [Thalassoglobus sp.]|uniref:rhomboid family intramembrane serine protease n=1 Tax=Thalassoglobus sp. TaxID=2795869 RepID=UPI003AA8B97D